MADDERDPSEPVDRMEIAEGPNPEGHDDQARAAHQRADAPPVQRRPDSKGAKKRAPKKEA